MKKIICLLLCAALLLPGCAVSDSAPSLQFYYRRTETAFGSEDGVVAPEPRELEESLESILEHYFQGPESRDLETPFPRNTRPVGHRMANSTLILTLSQEFAALTGVDLAIACACISRTFLQLDSVSQVRIQAENALLDGEQAIVMTEENLHLADDSLDRLLTTITVYYTDQDRRYLIGQDISVNLAEEDDVIDYLISQLAAAPKDSRLLSCLPTGTKLLSAQVDDGLCTLDLSGEFDSRGWTTSEAQRLTLMCLVNTLTQLEGVDRVEFSVEGDLLAQYRLLNISEPLVFDETVIGPVRTGVNEFDATLYVSNGSSLYLSPIPTRIRQTSGMTQAELVVGALLHFENRNGWSSTIPKDTQVNFVTVIEGVCQIDLSQEFLADPDSLQQPVRALIASVCALDEVRSARITVDGKNPDGDLAPYFGILYPEANWFL